MSNLRAFPTADAFIMTVRAAPNPAIRLAFSSRVEMPTASVGYPPPVRPQLPPTVAHIQQTVADYYRLTRADLISERRARYVARPRQVAMWLCRQLTMRSMPDIGRRFGGRDHTTVLHANRRIEALKLEDARLDRDCELLTVALGGRPR